MVRLSRIYTKFGDGGQCMLGDGSTVAKSHPRVEAYGDVDEANAAIGLAVRDCDHERDDTHRRIRDTLLRVQNELFDVGADLCAPVAEKEEAGKRLRIQPAAVQRLEALIDEFNAGLPTLDSFVLPGGSHLAASLHLARTITRRAERAATHLREIEPERTNQQACIYLNRLSDLLFVLARVANAPGARGGEGDVLWKPGGGEEGR